MLLEKIRRSLSDRYKLLLRGGLKHDRKLCISLWHEFIKPPYGGGNQFMMALEGGLERQGVLVVRNLLSPQVDVHICNSAWFDTKKFAYHAKKFPIKMIHRIDGPVSRYRGTDTTEDIKIHLLNKEFASATVYQSNYCRRESLALGFHAKEPVKIIGNAVNKEIFNSKGRRAYFPLKKIRLITSSWSDNPRKGGPLIKWLDSNLDWERFEYTFVGNIQQNLHHIKHIPPQDSEQLSNILREHDIYISASKNEPCSNALLEALACGLPALYRNEGGNPDIVGEGGLPFHSKHDVLSQLDRLVAQYPFYQSSISLKSIDDIAESYISLAKNIL